MRCRMLIPGKKFQTMETKLMRTNQSQTTILIGLLALFLCLILKAMIKKYKLQTKIEIFLILSLRQSLFCRSQLVKVLKMLRWKLQNLIRPSCLKNIRIVQVDRTKYQDFLIKEICWRNLKILPVLNKIFFFLGFSLCILTANSQGTYDLFKSFETEARLISSDQLGNFYLVVKNDIYK